MRFRKSWKDSTKTPASSLYSFPFVAQMLCDQTLSRNSKNPHRRCSSTVFQILASLSTHVFFDSRIPSKRPQYTFWSNVSLDFHQSMAVCSRHHSSCCCCLEVWSRYLQTALHLGLFDAMLMTDLVMERGKVQSNVSFSFHVTTPPLGLSFFHLGGSWVLFIFWSKLQQDPWPVFITVDLLAEL